MAQVSVSSTFPQDRHKRNHDEPQSHEEANSADDGNAKLNEGNTQGSKDQKDDRVYGDRWHRPRSIPQVQESA
jgi:hypothetical protein